jgi:hypothetical protein
MAAAPRSRTLGLDAGKILTLGGVAAAMFVAVIVNVLAARHFRRWDWTASHRYTLSPATVATLHELPDRVEVWVLLGSDDPLEQSVKQLLVSYASESSKLDIHYVDPDRDTAALLDVHKRFNIEAGRAEEGRTVTDAIMVVASGERHWFLKPDDMVEVTPDNESRAKPKEEQAITLAIRNVLAGAKARACFTSGHGEMALSDAGPVGLGVLKDLLEKDNFELATVDTTEPNAFEPFKGCELVVIAGPRGAFGKEEEARLKTYLMTGGSLFAAVSPIIAATDTGMEAPGILDAIAPFGVGLDEDVVLEVDPKLKIPGQKTAFFAIAKSHAVTDPLVRPDDGSRDVPRIMIGAGIPDSRTLTRSLRHVSPPGAASPANELLVTSASAFGVTSVVGATEWPEEGPEKKPTDVPGPLVLAMASERPKVSTTAPRGPRVVVVGTASVMAQRNWQDPLPVHGAAFFVGNAISWLTAHPAILDVPDKPSVAAGLRITDESRDQVRLYVLVYMPLAAALLGLAVALWRRSGEGKQRGEPGGEAK